tara:strand:- start:1071 stop:1631 length:561 start_codon:yes stop_codon:yes gene_type:complete
MASLFGLRYENIERFLESYAKYIIRQGQSILAKNSATGRLSDSLDFTIFKTDEGYEIRFTAAAYGDFRDKGVSGNISKRYYYSIDGRRKSSPYRYVNKQPPVSRLVDWLSVKGIQGRYKKGDKKKRGGRFMKKESLAYLIARSIKSKGIKALSFYSQPISYSFGRFKTELAQNFAKDIEAGLSIKI